MRFVFDKDNQFQIQWSFPIADLNPELKLSLQVINRLLDDGSSSRLQRIIREEKGLVYDISASLSYYDMGAVFNINTLVSTENLSALMDSLCHLVRDLCENGVLKSELDLVKKRYKTFLDCYLDNASGHLYEAVGHEIFPYFQDSKTILSSLDNLQLGQIKETLKTIFDQAQTYFVLVGPCTESIKDELSKYLAPWIEIPQED
ncbi:MAG: insulinase family protein [Deltaproteobacteria bacterium]|nr:insulinase family protein [Deltaproteobacteria bacterium]